MSGDEVEKTLREWVTQEVNRKPLCITFPEAQNFELKSRLIHLLPMFIGLENEDPHKFLKEFHVVCSGIKPHAITEDRIKLRAFPFSLQDSARKWLYELPFGSITTWTELVKLRHDTNRNSGVDQKAGNKVKHFGNKDEWYPDQPWGVKEVNNAHMESQISKLTKVVLLLTKEKIVANKPCGICLKTKHPTYMCLLLQEDVAPVNAPNFQISNQQKFQSPNFQNQNSRQQPSSFSVALEYIGKSHSTSTQVFQTKTRANIKNLEQQVSQLATFVGRLEPQGKLPRHTENNLKHNVSVISLRIRKRYGDPGASEPGKESPKRNPWDLTRKNRVFTHLLGEIQKRLWFCAHNIGSMIISSIIAFVKWRFFRKHHTNRNSGVDRKAGNKVKHFGNKDEWYPDHPWCVKEVNNAHMESQISKLTKVVLLLTKEKIVAKKPCGNCLKTKRPKYMCLLLQEDSTLLEAIRIIFSRNSNIRCHPDSISSEIINNRIFSPTFKIRINKNFRVRIFRTRTHISNPKSLATSTQVFQTKTRANIKNLEQQVSQLATFVGRLEPQGKLPRHTENNLKHNVSVIFLRIRKRYGDPRASEPGNEVLVEEESGNLEEKETPTPEKSSLKEYKPLPPFPSRLKNTKCEREDTDIMKIFRKVEVNLPLLYAIEHIPRYTISKKKLKFNENIKPRKKISLILQKALPPKCKDPGIFSIPCKLGNLNFPRPCLT
uniref:Retrotransposon gag domain-containing protein n=1 Tax=Lactuca sativa TaxID=4236 RepID=A0A9R1WCP9_LACSA|nr:hypothetical protein LSAT_V11C200078700 [Lactuca sativa]